MLERPLGPEIDANPRPLPARIPVRGHDAVLEPLHRRHAPDLWQAAQAEGGAASWDYLPYGPFASEQALAAYVADFASQHDPMAWAVRPIATGKVTGWLTLMDIQPKNAAIEIGHIWFAPAMQRTRAATEAMFLLMRLAMDELGYRRLVWKCNALNAPSRRAAERLGFTEEGTLRAHLVVKGRRRDTAFYSILGDEWPHCRDALLRWLDPANFEPDGTARSSLSALRAGLLSPSPLGEDWGEGLAVRQTLEAKCRATSILTRATNPSRAKLLAKLNFANPGHELATNELLHRITRNPLQ